MDTITFQKKELKNVIEESLREVLNQEIMKFRTLLLPPVSEREQKDIEKRYGYPRRKIEKTVEIEL